ncbi:MAG: molybdopterin-binding protein, partial [Actinomycetes bacterium]
MRELPSPAWLRADSPPQWWPRPPRRLRDAAAAVSVGRWLGLAFAVCMVTGVFSHYHQHPVGWLPLPTRPVWVYQVTQGLHVMVGLAAIPLLLAKLWTVYPRLFSWPPARTVVQILERLSIAVLVAGAVFELATGLLNILQWYPWPFGFIQAHWWVAWLTIGALLVHLAVKAPLIAAHWRTRRAPDPPPRLREDVAVSRRTVLLAAGTAAAAVTVVTAGQTVPWLRRTAALAPRLPGPGAAGLPINRTAAAAGVEQTAVDPTWALQIGGRTPSALGLADLAGLPQQTSRLPISCVEGWSATASWTGVR